MARIKVFDNDSQSWVYADKSFGKDGKTPVKGVDYFDGKNGYTPVRGVDYYTDADKAEFEAYIATELAKRGQLKPEFAQTIEECTDTTKLYVLPDGMIYAYMYAKVEVGGYTNLIDTADADFKTSSRINDSNAVASTTNANAFVSNFIEAKSRQIIRIKGVTSDSSTTISPRFKVLFCKEDGSPIACARLVDDGGTGSLFVHEHVEVSDDGVYTYQLGKQSNGVVSTYDTTLAKIRVSGIATDGFDNVIVTLDEEIVELEIVKQYQWASTGHAFAPTDYEDRIIDLENKVDELEKSSSSIEDGSITPEKTSFIICEGTGELESTLVPNFTNLANPKSSDWKTDTRFSSSAGSMSSTAGAIVTNAIPAKRGDVIRIKGIKGGSGATANALFQLVGYKTATADTHFHRGFFFEKIPSQIAGGVKNIVTVENGVTEYTLFMSASGDEDYTGGQIPNTTQDYDSVVAVRIGGVPVTTVDDIIITINEPITYTEVTSSEKIYTLDEKIVVPRANGLKSGAKWFALGDSITEGYASKVDSSASSGYKQFLNTNEAERWVNIVADLNGYELTNYGVGCSGYVHATNNAKAQADKIDFSKCDFVTLAYGVNDWKYAANVGAESDIPQTVVSTYDAHNSIKVAEGTATDSVVYKNGVLLTPTTDYSISGGYLVLTTNTAKNDMFDIYGATESMVGNMCYVIKKIIRDNPICKIFVITPVNCRSLGTYATNWGINYDGSAASGPGLEQIFKLQKAVCEEYGIELIDMTHCSIINRENIKTMLPDYVHPTVECHRLIARELAQKIAFR